MVEQRGSIVNSQMKSRISVDVGRVRLGRVVQQYLDDVDLRLARGVVQRRVVLVVLSVNCDVSELADLIPS